LFFLSAFFLPPSAFDFMKLVSFVAGSAADALAEIQRRLGPDAVVVSVRPVSFWNISRLWRKNCKIEVTAGVPDKTSAPKPDTFSPPGQIPESAGGFASGDRRWRSVTWLEAMGLLPVHAERLQMHLRAVHGEAPPEPLEEEWQVVSRALSHFWLKPPPIDGGAEPRPHVFIGPPGSGKTTALCKWLTLASLLEERAARVWRLDGSTANTAEFLALHCEMLGVPLERFWSNPGTAGELWFVDLPGVDIADAPALDALRRQIAGLPSPRVHLVLNAAYEMPALLAQWRAFEPCGPEDLIFTHLDEETRRVKLWNFVFGTNCSLRFLGAGQKIPGEFRNASPEILLPAKNP
jgi:flagellar biosynthesis protein FlhF